MTRQTYAIVMLTLSLIGLGFLLTFAPAYAERRDYFPEALLRTLVKCPDFPEGRPVLTNFRIGWYSSHLSAAQEPSLFENSLSRDARAKRTYRLSWIRSFHSPIFVRLDYLPEGGVQLTAKRTSGLGGYGPGGLAETLRRRLTPAEIADIERVLAGAQQLDLPPIGCESGSDGAQVVLEANDRGHYWFVDRWTPKDGPARDIAAAFLKLTGWRFSHGYRMPEFEGRMVDRY